jgi:hypothetical protein
MPGMGVTLVVGEDFSQEVKNFVIDNHGKRSMTQLELRALASTREKKVYFCERGAVYSGYGRVKDFAQVILPFNNLGFR